jgi:hypothetical protein
MAWLHELEPDKPWFTIDCGECTAVAKFEQGKEEGGMTNRDIGPMRIITVDDVPYQEFPGSADGFLTTGAWIKHLAPGDSGLHFIIFKLPPRFESPGHWHDFDTIYLVKSGEFHIEGEGPYRPGDVRWVRGGTAYGAERAGEDGCEVYVISMGPIATHDPAKELPPHGFSHELLASEKARRESA